MEPLTIACVKWGDAYSAQYVNILFDMVRRNLPEGYAGKFVCFTDNADGIDDGVEIRALPEGLHGWWNKLYLFKEGVFTADERVLYIDLDTIITGSLDELVKYDGAFAILRDFYRPCGFGSGVMAWRGGFGGFMWDAFEVAGRPQIEGGDQAWIERMGIQPDMWQDLHPGWFQSYKTSCREMFPKGTKLVCFHGAPKPHEVLDGWVPQLWKKGGGTSLELLLQANVSEEELVANIRHSLTLNLPLLESAPEHDGHAVIVGGAPSLKVMWPEIKQRQEAGQHIFAVNNTSKFLSEHGIDTDYYVLLDARPENVDFIPANIKRDYLLSSQCCPAAFEKIKNPIVWHSYADGMESILKEEKRAFTYVGGGCTVGLKSICIAYIMGYRKFHLYGFDSCYQDDAHHAYTQSLNDKERVIEVTFRDMKYKAAPWMVTQVEQFKELASGIIQMGGVITIHGDGLFQDVARSMAE